VSGVAVPGRRVWQAEQEECAFPFLNQGLKKAFAEGFKKISCASYSKVVVKQV
jgi:hypothetical protein